jgi:hypothetical protein
MILALSQHLALLVKWILLRLLRAQGLLRLLRQLR